MYKWDISLSLKTNENIYLFFDNYAKRMGRLEIEFPNKSKLEILQQVNQEYLYFYTIIIKQYLKNFIVKLLNFKYWIYYIITNKTFWHDINIAYS